MIINKFEGKYAFLSNFYASIVQEDGITYPTIEHYFQAQKTLNPFERKEIAAAATPGRAKRLGRNVTLREDWEEVKDSVMLQGLRLKFDIEELANMLIATGDAYLEEGNQWGDTTWGVCQDIGENRLGKLLMQVRQELKEKGEIRL